MPFTSSNSTAEPTTSNMLGRTLTLTPSDFTIRITSSRYASEFEGPGAITARSISCSTSSSPSVPRSPRMGTEPLRVSRSVSGTRPTSSAFTPSEISSLRRRCEALRPSPISTIRSARLAARATWRASARPAVIDRNSRIQRPISWSRPRWPSTNSPPLRDSTSEYSVATPNSVGASSSVSLWRTCWSWSYSPIALLSSGASGIRTTALGRRRSEPSTRTATNTATTPDTTSARPRRRRCSASRRSVSGWLPPSGMISACRR